MSHTGSTHKKSTHKKIETKNERYLQLRHSLFVAGDIDQFEQHRLATNGTDSARNITTIQNVWSSDVAENLDHPLYRNLSVHEVDTTFRYLFDKFKKSIFVKIQDNRLAVFLPFTKIKFVNEWGHRILPPPGQEMSEFLIEASRRQGFPITESDLTLSTSQWYANNCLVRYENPIRENDRGYLNFREMLETVCANREVPDMEFFLNKRDFPLLKKDGTEPYEHIFGEGCGLVSHHYAKYCPILSMVTTDQNADIPVPTAEDWARIVSQDPTHPKILPGCRSYAYDFSLAWDQRRPTAVFRGGSTGCGVTLADNPRLRIAKMSQTSPRDDGIPLLDAGITSWNLRPRKCSDSPHLKMIDPIALGLETVGALTPVEQAQYKYIVNVDGHVSAFRLSLELSMGSVILLVKSRYRMWFTRHLVEGVHYLSVEADLSDLYGKIRWCRAHDDECQVIAENAKKFYRTYLSRTGVLDFWQAMLCRLHQTTGTYFYNTVSADAMVLECEQQWVTSLQPSLLLPPPRFIAFPFRGRPVRGMDALRRLIGELGGIEGIIEQPGFPLYPVKSGKPSATSVVAYALRRSKTKVIVKRTERMAEMINEAMCGLGGVNELIATLPHFRYTYFFDAEKEQLISEHIEGKTLKEWLLRRPTTSSELLQIVLMIAMALAVAQEKIGFVHYDLYPWNIVIQEYSKPHPIHYRFETHLFTISSRFVPVLIDYGRSHMIYRSHHVGRVNPFKMNRYQDVMNLVLGVVNECLERTDHTIMTTPQLMGLVNFFAETEFLPNRIQTEAELIAFVTQNARYNEMIYGTRRHGMIDRTPIEFIFDLLGREHFLTENGFQLMQISGSRKMPLVIPSYHHPDFYYAILTANEEAAIRAVGEYLVRLERESQEWFSDPVDIKFYYALNMVAVAVKATRDFMEMIRKEDAAITSLWGAIDAFLTAKLQIVRDRRITLFRPGYISVAKGLMASRYQSRSFSNPSYILTLLEGFSPQSDDFVTYREMVMWTSLYEMPQLTPQSKLIEYHHDIFGLSPLTVMVHNANGQTLKTISRLVYQRDLETIANLPEKNKKVMHNVMIIAE